MKRLGSLLLIAILVLSFAAIASAEVDTTNLSRGFKNVASSPLEIPKAIAYETEENNALFGLVFGTIRGVCNMFSKTISGIVDIVTFNPGSDAKEPVFKPEMHPVD